MAVPTAPGTLACTVVERFPVSVVRVDGVLSVDTAPIVRSVLLKQLATQPEAVVVDLTETVAIDDVGLTVFGAAARSAAKWPAVPLVLCSVPTEVLEAIDRLALNRDVPVFRTRHDALVNLRKLGTAQRRHTMELRPEPESAALARHAVERACLDWDLPHLLEPARVVIAELVANAIVHAQTAIQVRLALRDQYLHMAVHDRSRTPARLLETDELLDQTGRGLLLVDALATAWGSARTADGKVVWATLRVRPAGTDSEN
jgi:anti-anti-sigma regulatory factor/anti-sigma regulatory factor (Ser/Thr protein kinase)